MVFPGKDCLARRYPVGTPMSIATKADVIEVKRVKRSAKSVSAEDSDAQMSEGERRKNRATITPTTNRVITDKGIKHKR